ncbi:hypothetical protein FBY14_11834 [Azospirillum brasilense]|nr:hypothetical protein FBY14_11834 [Azospirillum brasilense]
MTMMTLISPADRTGTAMGMRCRMRNASCRR